MPSPSPKATSVVLCIEDDPIQMDLIEAILSSQPELRVLKATNGTTGVAEAKRHRPDLVLLDMQLPDISGLQVVRELSLQISQGPMRVVLLTAEPFSIDVIKAMSLGAHAYWPKPLDMARIKTDLRRMLDEAMRETPPDGGGTGTP